MAAEETRHCVKFPLFKSCNFNYPSIPGENDRPGYRQSLREGFAEICSIGPGAKRLSWPDSV